MLTTSEQVCRLKALTAKIEEMKRTEPSESVLAACEAVINMTNKQFNTFAEKSRTEHKE